MSDSHSVVNKVVLVTGASSGLGRRFAKVLAEQGAAVGIAARRTDALAELVGEIEASGGKAFATSLDVGSEQSINDCVAIVERALGPIDVLAGC